MNIKPIRNDEDLKNKVYETKEEAIETFFNDKTVKESLEL